jgi:thioredoxin-related protein
MKKIGFLFILALIVITSGSFIKAPKEASVHWLTFEEAQIAYKNNPKPFLIDVYTSWCTWCKTMEKETYSKDSVANYINEHYYAIRLDAETKDTIVWRGTKFGFKPEYRANEFAAYLLNGQMSFPTTVFLSDITAQPAALPGYMKPNEFEPPLKYFGEGVYKTEPFTEYMKTFSAKWK